MQTRLPSQKRTCRRLHCHAFGAADVTPSETDQGQNLSEAAGRVVLDPVSEGVSSGARRATPQGQRNSVAVQVPA